MRSTINYASIIFGIIGSFSSTSINGNNRRPNWHNFVHCTVEDVSCDVDIAKWWKNNELPAWAEACKLGLLVQPSSTAAERVLSLLESSYSHKQNTSLQYNNKA